MKKVLLSVVLVISFCSFAWAESSVWKAQKGASILYLGGTLHILRDADYPLPPEFDKAYRASEIMVFETDISQLQDPSTQLKMLAKGMYPDGSSIEQHLSEKTYAELSAYCADNGISLQMLSRFKPSLTMTALIGVELVKLGVTQHGVDLHFFDLAKKDKKLVQGLETLDEQIEYMTSMADGDEDAFISYSLKDLKTTRDQFELLATAWRKGDTGKLDELMTVELKTRQPKLYKKLILDRNARWLKQIDAYRNSGKTRFLLVGLAHLVGTDGLVEALKRRGYKVERI